MAPRYLDEHQPKKPSANDEEKLLAEIRERFDYAEKEWAEIRAEAAKDMRYVAGDPWEPEDRRQREEAGRPCLSLDELGQHFNQVINGVRSEKRAVKFSPKGHGATDATAQLYTDLMREIEYRSHAQVAYTTAFQDCIHRGYGFIRVKTEYESDRSFNQQLKIEPFVNPDMVLPDPDAQRPDSSDMRYCFVLESRSKKEFPREFPDAKIADFSNLGTVYPQWVKAERILIAEYWTIKTKKRKLLLIQPPALPAPPGMRPPPAGKPEETFEDELDLAGLPPGAVVMRARDVQWPTVCQYLTNGVEILSTTEWPGKYIPIISCYGMVIYVEGKRKILSMTRLARDPYMLYCYYRTCQAELVGMTPKIPYFVRRGSLSPDQLLNLQKSLHEPMAVIEVDSYDERGNPYDWPQRNPYDPRIDILDMGAESARRAIQAAMGASPLPTQAQRRNEKSGIALEHIADSSQRGSFHFNDHFDDMIRQTGVVNEDLIDKVIDTAREIGVREPNDAVSMRRVNDPADPTSVSTKGDHSVTVSTGPEYESARQAESEFADTLMATPFAPLIADLAVKLKGGGPVLDEMAERLTPPQFKKSKEGEGPDPAQLQQQLAGMQQQLQELSGVAQQMAEELKSKQAENASKERIAQAEIASQERLQVELQKLKNAASIAVAQIGAQSKGVQMQTEAANEAQALAREQAHEVGLTAMEQQHDRDMAQHQAALSAEQADQQHAQQLEAGQIGHAQSLEAQQQAAALKPTPEVGGGA